MAKKWFDLSAKEKRDLNMVANAYFDLMIPREPRPTKYQMIKWIRKYHKREKE